MTSPGDNLVFFLVFGSSLQLTEVQHRTVELGFGYRSTPWLAGDELNCEWFQLWECRSAV